MRCNIIEIDAAKCNGCGLCASACHEGAIGIVDGKARLLRDDYCDGLGNCLPACPQDAITMVQREAPAFDQEAVETGQPAESVAGTAAADAGTRRLLPGRASSDRGGLHGLYQRRLPPALSVRAGNAHRLPQAGSGGLCRQAGRPSYRKTTFGTSAWCGWRCPGCGGMEFAIRRALEQSGKQIPLHITVLSTNGKIIQEGE